MTIQELRAENRQLGWAEIPEDCPERGVQRICEYRARVLAGKETRAAAPPSAEVASLRQRLAETKF